MLSLLSSSQTQWDSNAGGKINVKKIIKKLAVFLNAFLVLRRKQYINTLL